MWRVAVTKIRIIGEQTWIGVVFDAALVEIRAAEGGNDAKLLVNDLFQIYCRWCQRRGFKIEILDSAPDKGGFSRLEFSVKGQGAYEAFLFEAGGHRVQRVPITEKRGRRQTSTVTVAVLPMVGEEEFAIEPLDLDWETKKGGGHGGQNMQKNETAVRLRHIPTGITVCCQDERSQKRNKDRALEVLRARLYAKQLQESSNSENVIRKKQLGSGQRGDKIRTYRFQDNRVVDNKTGKKVQLSDILAGDLDILH
jgi:peptide chain release factor 1